MFVSGMHVGVNYVVGQTISEPMPCLSQSDPQ